MTSVNARDTLVQTAGLISLLQNFMFLKLSVIALFCNRVRFASDPCHLWCFKKKKH